MMRNARPIGLMAVAMVCLLNASVDAQLYLTPTNLGPSVNSAYSEAGPSLSADGLTLFFSSDRPGGYGYTDLWMSSRASTSDPFGEAVDLGGVVNSTSRDDRPCISADGLTLYFTSGRTGGEGDWDIWVASRASTLDPFGSPSNLSSINTAERETRPSISSDGLTLYFTSDRTGGYGGLDIWASTRSSTAEPFGEPSNLGSIVNSVDNEGGAHISADGLSLMLNSTRPGGIGGQDLWMASRDSVAMGFGIPVNLGSPVNSTFVDNAASRNADNSILVFNSGRDGGLGGADIWIAEVPEPATLSLLALGGVAVLKRRRGI